MFEDILKNKNMLEGAYRKLKSYYFYNKNFIVMRDKISCFENDSKSMDKTLELLALYLSRPGTINAKIYFDNLYSKIDFYIMPKKFDSVDIENKNRPVSNTISRDKKMKTVNFLIDMPIELHILDTLWTLYLGKFVEDNHMLSTDVYGNIIKKSVVSDFNNNEGIDYQTNQLFNNYFYQYSNWRNKAFDALEQNYKKGQDSILISLDLQAYYYSIKFSFSKLRKQMKVSGLWNEIQPLNSIMEKVFSIYKELISSYRKDLASHSLSEYPLPIGLFSSMVLGNLYLCDLDNKAKNLNNISYYGRYVDDLLFVCKCHITIDEINDDVVKRMLVDKGLFLIGKNGYTVINLPNLKIQKDKVKIIYLDHTESRALIDIYNSSIRIIPSQINPIPDFDLNISSFDENAYNIEHFNKENKLRDIGHVNIDSYKVSRFFSTLIMKFSHINSFDNNYMEIKDEITNNIQQVEKFFTGSQCIEYYSNWMNYMYFLVITQRWKNLKSFYNQAKKNINNLEYNHLDKGQYKKTERLNKRTKKFLINHLDVCRASALSLDIVMVNKHFSSLKQSVLKYINSNMFNHSLIAFPLANYLTYDKDTSYIKMDIKDIGKISKLDENIKFKWSPRFIHYDELLMLLFYDKHKKNQKKIKVKFQNNDFVKEEIVKKYIKVNHLNCGENSPFEIGYNDGKIIHTSNNENCKYNLQELIIPVGVQNCQQMLNIAVANIKLQPETIKSAKDDKYNRWKNITLDYKAVIQNILRETYKYNTTFGKHCPKILVFPELSIPIYWFDEVIRFSKKTQTAIVSGVQYIYDEDGRTYNYILTILPFEAGNKRYKNAFVYIREKNDYSPIEKIELAKTNKYCIDTSIAEYQVFSWKGISLAAFLCYEFTDITARALLKGKCDIIAAPVFNQDTTYFSNIIDTAVRDLHAFIVQANTSIFGDSRVTGPYDRDNKDIFKIKGGDNDNVIIGTLNFAKYAEYQASYYKNLEKKIINAKTSHKNKKVKKKRSKPEIKPLSARFCNKRTNNDE